MLTATFQKYVLDFIQPGGTSRGVMVQRVSWFLFIKSPDKPDVIGIGECPPLPGLSRDDIASIENTLTWVTEHINDERILDSPVLWNFPSVLFGLETALNDLQNGGLRQHFDTSFTSKSEGLPINGLVWMGPVDKMREQIKSKTDQGFRCIKLKIGALGIDNEIQLIQEIRKAFGNEIEIRVDANGAFNYNECRPVLDALSKLNVHSIEQPIKAGLFEEMSKLCAQSPVPIALDEDIVSWSKRDLKHEILDFVKPSYLILKPGLIGGFQETSSWIHLADKKGIPWWITSALESNIGLNAIAQYTSQFPLKLAQGLGTGQVFSNNFSSPLFVDKGFLYYNKSTSWNLKNLNV